MMLYGTTGTWSACVSFILSKHHCNMEQHCKDMPGAAADDAVTTNVLLRVLTGWAWARIHRHPAAVCLARWLDHAK